MLDWYIEKQELRCTPSILDGFDVIKEAKCRKEGARFIQELGKQLGLGCATIATGIVYFQRFYLTYSFKKIPKYLAACCCLFLSGKVEETPKRAKDIIRTAKEILTDTEFQELGEDPRRGMMMLENVLLKAVQFNFNIDHPYNCILKYAKCFKGTKGDLEKLVQSAWIFVNDSLCTTICLQWKPEIIAIASLHLASKINRFIIDDWENRKANQCNWWETCAEGLTIKMVEGVCHELLDMYTSRLESSQKAEKSDCVGSKNDLMTETYVDKTVNSILNIDIPSREINMPSDYNNVFDKPILATATLNLNEDVWNVLKKIQVNDITPASIIFQENILSTSCYYNSMPSLNLKDTDFKLGASNNNFHDATNFLVSKSNSNHMIYSNNNCLSYDSIPTMKPSVSIQELGFEPNKLCIPLTPDMPPPNTFSEVSNQNTDLKEINNINLVPLLPAKPYSGLTLHKSKDLFPLSNLIPCETPTDHYSSSTFSYSLLQTVAMPPPEQSRQPSLLQPFCLPQNLHPVSDTFQNEENIFQTRDFGTPSTSTELLYSPIEIASLPNDPSSLEEYPYLEVPSYLPREPSYLPNGPSFLPERPHLLENHINSPTGSSVSATSLSDLCKGPANNASGSKFQFAIPKARNKSLKLKRNFSKIRSHIYR